MWHHILSLTSLCCLVLEAGGQGQSRPASTCSSMAFRKLSPQLQNEHTCLLLEQIQVELNSDKDQRTRLFGDIVAILSAVERKLGIMRERSKKLKDLKDSGNSPLYIPRDVPQFQDCYDLWDSSCITSPGVYPLKMPDHDVVMAQCDMETVGSGWTIIQRRIDGSINFTRNWNEYKDGFGNPNTEYWLGLERMYSLTASRRYTLRIDMWDWSNNTAHATYDDFRVDGEEHNYRLHVSGYSGTAGDSLSTYHNNVQFSTPDSDNDQWYGQCARKDGSGWWFNACSYTSLNGQYNVGGRSEMGPNGIIRGIHWYHWKKDYTYSLKRVEMKIRPKITVRSSECT